MSQAGGSPQRPLRVLHIGNIANNAYKNAKLLNEAGLDCDVICYDYYHVMAAPEWEDAEIKGDVKDQFLPDWTAVKLHGFKRPAWFAQGPMFLCLQYLLARRRRQQRLAQFWWAALATARFVLCNRHCQRLVRVARLLRVSRVARKAWRLFKSLLLSTRVPAGSVAARTGRKGARMPTPAAAAAITSDAGSRRTTVSAAWGAHGANESFTDRAELLVAEWQRCFPERPDRLTLEEVQDWAPWYPHWKELFAEYDLVQGYATDPWLALLYGKRPYVAYEHGTIREIPFTPTLQGRITALSYALADGVLVTNGDCFASVPRLNIRNAAAMVHAVDERVYFNLNDRDPELARRFGCQYLFLCTLRHDWAIKGTDLYLRALPLLAERLGRSFKLLLTRWGVQIEESKALLAELKVEDLVVWMDPLPRRALIRMMKSVDALFDQTALPHFGATAPEGIAAGVPVLMSYDPRSTSAIVKEPAPILAVFSVADVVAQSLKAIDPTWRSQYKQVARRWILENHSARRVVQGHLAMYESCLNLGAAAGLGSGSGGAGCRGAA
jgi:glycosyltransferase involved in cell wall biosynthesis